MGPDIQTHIYTEVCPNVCIVEFALLDCTVLYTIPDVPMLAYDSRSPISRLHLSSRLLKAYHVSAVALRWAMPPINGSHHCAMKQFTFLMVIVLLRSCACEPPSCAAHNEPHVVVVANPGIYTSFILNSLVDKINF